MEDSLFSKKLINNENLNEKDKYFFYYYPGCLYYYFLEKTAATSAPLLQSAMGRKSTSLASDIILAPDNFTCYLFGQYRFFQDNIQERKTYYSNPTDFQPCLLFVVPYHFN